MKFSRKEWLIYMLGVMEGTGWEISKEDAEDFKRAFPEVPERFINFAIRKEPSV
jgi:hypothetical protein